MRSAVLEAPGRIKLVEAPVPAPGRGEVLVRLRAVGICGSDVHYYTDGRIGDAVARYPFVLGHEPAGEVAAAGDGVADLRPGDRVALEPALSCGACPICLAGRPNCCPRVRFLGSPPVPGVFEEYHVFAADQCVPIPESMSWETAATLEPLAVAMHAVNLARLRLGDRVAVMGGGPIGLLTAAAARLSGASFVALTEPLPARRDAATRFRVDLALDPGEADLPARLNRAAGEIDAAFEAAGAQEAVDHATLAVRPGGTAVIIGIPTGDRLALWVHPLRRKELNLVLARRSNGTLPAAIRLVSEGWLHPEEIVTHRFPLDRLGEAMELVHHYADGVIKAMIVFPD